jgi:hypothetical protein
VPTTSPRYSAPDRSRQRVRLIAAIGLLASTALAIGGLVGLLEADEESPTVVGGEAARKVEPSSSRSGREPLNPLDSRDALILEVERAERAASSARAALRRARAIGEVDVDQLDWLERRLDALGRPSAMPSTAPSHPPSDARAPSDPAGPFAQGPREL